jgi:hypothetical protein
MTELDPAGAGQSLAIKPIAKFFVTRMREVQYVRQQAKSNR